MTLTIQDVPDDLIREEYVKRYTLKAGEKLNSSKSVASHLESVLLQVKNPRKLCHDLSQFAT